MLAELTVGQFLEGTMLTCFGCSWPISILKSLRTKFVRGKSIGFMGLVIFGYLAGTTAKFFRAAEQGTSVEWVTALYVLNALLVATDLFLYFKYRHNTETIVLPRDQEIAK